MTRALDVATLRPDLTDEGAGAARATLARWQRSPVAWRIFCANVANWRDHGHPVTTFAAGDAGYFRVMEAAANALLVGPDRPVDLAAFGEAADRQATIAADRAVRVLSYLAEASGANTGVSPAVGAGGAPPAGPLFALMGMTLDGGQR